MSDVGPIQRVFRPGRANMAAGLILAALCFAGSAFGFFSAAKAVIDHRGSFPDVRGEWNWVGVGIVCVLSILGIALGLSFVWLTRSWMAVRVELGTSGLAITEQAGSRTILWDDIALMEEKHDALPRRYGLPPQISKIFTVNPRDGEPFSFEENAIKRHLVLAEMIRRETDARSVPWIVTRS